MRTVDLRARDLETLTAVFRRFPHVECVTLFGSRATGTARRASDIDLAMFAPDATDEEWFAFCEAIDEAPVIFELDVLRLDAVSSERLREKIDREGVPIYTRDA